MPGLAGRVRRDDILQNARKILDSGQYHALTVDALARTARMSKSTLYKHFAGKDQVVVSLVEQECEATTREVEEAERAESAARLRELSGVLARHWGRLPRAVVLQRDQLPAECIAEMSRATERVRRELQRAAAGLASEGTSLRLDPALAATALVGVADAAAHASASGEVTQDTEQSVRLALDVVLRGLRG